MSASPLSLAEVFVWGRVVKAHGLRGHLIAESFSEAPDKYDISAFWIKQGDSLIPQSVEYIHSYETSDKNKPLRWWRLRFSGMRSRTEAENWIGVILYLPRSYLPPLTGNSFYYIEAENALVVDEKGLIRGRLAEIYPGNAYDFFIVENGAGEVFWIPAPFVKGLDRGTQPPTLMVEGPEGLWDPTLAQ
ncbi:MAG: hypothetical protein NZZ60_02425, partial [Bacteroidia bacterium]|nr:hypothetical protein [Bacteroidia bacterium]